MEDAGSKSSPDLQTQCKGVDFDALTNGKVKINNVMTLYGTHAAHLTPLANDSRTIYVQCYSSLIMLEAKKKEELNCAIRKALQHIPCSFSNNISGLKGGSLWSILAHKPIKEHI